MAVGQANSRAGGLSGVGGERRVDTSEQVVLVEWLAQVTNHPIPQRALPRAVVRVRGDQNGRYALSGRHQVAMQLDPCHTRHLHVRDQTRGAGDLAGAQELFCGCESFGRISQRLHEPPDRLTHRLIVVDDRDQGLGFRHFTSLIVLPFGPSDGGGSTAFWESKTKPSSRRLYFGLSRIVRERAWLV